MNSTYNQFWEALRERSRGKIKLFSTISPSHKHYITKKGVGKSGCEFSYNIYEDGSAIALYIDHDKSKGGLKNKLIYDKLNEQRDAIEKEVGVPLKWLRHSDDGKRACRIEQRFSMGSINEPDMWPELQDAMIEAMIKFDKAFRARLENINV